MATNRASRAPDLSLDDQIDKLRSDIRTDKLDMTFGEFANLYEQNELIISPPFQRLYRWTSGQKFRFIESLLLGIPTPAIFVAETETGIWELVDGLQRLSTVFEFFGILRDTENKKWPPLKLVADESATLPALDSETFRSLSLRSRLSLRRAGCRVEVVKVGSGRRMKYDLFERLNTGGVTLTPQEVRNCIFRDQAPDLMDYFDGLAADPAFQNYLGLSDVQTDSLFDRGLVLRFFALKNNISEFRHDVEPFITEYVYKLADGKEEFDKTAEAKLFARTIKAITDSLKFHSWKHLRDNKAGGPFSVYVFEALSLAVARHINKFEKLAIGDRVKRLNAVKRDTKFREAVGAGANTRNKLLQRLERANMIIGAQRP